MRFPISPSEIILYVSTPHSSSIASNFAPSPDRPSWWRHGLSPLIVMAVMRYRGTPQQQQPGDTYLAPSHLPVFCPFVMVMGLCRSRQIRVSRLLKIFSRMTYAFSVVIKLWKPSGKPHTHTFLLNLLRTITYTHTHTHTHIHHIGLHRNDPNSR